MQASPEPHDDIPFSSPEPDTVREHLICEWCEGGIPPETIIYLSGPAGTLSYGSLYCVSAWIAATIQDALDGNTH